MKTSSPIKILICVLTMHERAGWVCKHLSEFLTGIPLIGGDYQFAITYAHNFIPAASARNRICQNTKEMLPEQRPDWLLMIDNDMAPPANLLDTVKDAPADAAVVVPQFQMWDESKPSVTLCWGMHETVSPLVNGHQRTTIEWGKWYELTKCGTGAVFIKPEVFDKISMPYFWYTYNEEQGMEGTEDINFCNKVLDAGLKIYGNGSIQVGHYHNVNLQVLANYIYAKQEGVNSKKLELGEAECPSDISLALVSPT